ncbi:hypothetical protein NDU88_003493 [Pleurodeles waltl]|uniref:Uncharacterized protein n=1 Tax=Pleurodeles waltl TaxID=8319 RepID=A0AAV7LFH4_PLEWA|nr:hypothetical protein NDU88_003493 [Pleurodeles waltl]
MSNARGVREQCRSYFTAKRIVEYAVSRVCVSEKGVSHILLARPLVREFTRVNLRVTAVGLHSAGSVEKCPWRTLTGGDPTTAKYFWGQEDMERSEAGKEPKDSERSEMGEETEDVERSEGSKETEGAERNKGSEEEEDAENSERSEAE